MIQSPRTARGRRSSSSSESISLITSTDHVFAAVEPSIRATFLTADDRNAMAITRLVGICFHHYLHACRASARLAGGSFSRWIIIGSAVVFWSLASGVSGLAAKLSERFCSRVSSSVSEKVRTARQPHRSFPIFFRWQTRGRVLAIFCAAIPVGSALGYVFGGLIDVHLGWRWAFYLVAPPGLLPRLILLFPKDPRARGLERPERQRATLEDYPDVVRTPSYVFNCIAQTAMTFALGGIGFWVAAYLQFRGQPASSTKFLATSSSLAGLVFTLLGGWAGSIDCASVSRVHISWCRGFGILPGLPVVRGDVVYAVSCCLDPDVRGRLFHVP